MKINRRVGIGTAALILIAAGVGTAVALGSGSGSGKTASTVTNSIKRPAWCTDPSKWAAIDAHKSICSIDAITGCNEGNSAIDAKIDTTDTGGGSSGRLIQQLIDISAKVLKEPDVPAPILSAWQKQHADLETELDLYRGHGDWVEVNTGRTINKADSPDLVCLDFAAQAVTG